MYMYFTTKEFNSCILVIYKSSTQCKEQKFFGSHNANEIERILNETVKIIQNFGLS